MIFSILNLYYTNFEKSLKNLSFILGKDEERFFVNRRKILNYGFPCLDFKDKEVKLGCKDIRFFNFNLPYFLYTYVENIYSSTQHERIIKSIMDYVSYKGDIISYLYTMLDVNKEYYHDYVYDESFYHIFNQYDYYGVFLYLYFIRNFVIFGGRETISSRDRYDFVINLDYDSIVKDLRVGILQSIERIEDIRQDEEYKYQDMLKRIKTIYLINLMSSILNFIKEYFKGYFNINVEYRRKVENNEDNEEYDEDEYDDYFDVQDYETTYDCDVYYFVFINLLNRDFVVNLVLDYTFFDYIEQNHYHLFGEPFRMNMTLIKMGNNIKIATNVTIDKNVQEIDKTLIYFDDVLMKQGNHEYEENDERRFYRVNVLSILNSDEHDFVNLINDALHKIIESVKLDKIYLTIM